MTTRAVLVCLVMLAGHCVQGQTINVNTYTNWNADYDFEVHARVPGTVTKYVIQYTLEDGSVLEDGPYDTWNHAAQVIFFNYEHGLMPAGTIDASIVERQVERGFIFYGKYDTLWEANSIASQLEWVGLETEIVWVRARRFNFRYSAF